LTACGDSGDSGASNTAKPAVATGAKAFDPIQQYIGGTGKGAADPTKKPVVLGYVNTTGGPTATPAWSTTAKAAERVINEELGGIDGHPLKLKTCELSGSEGQGQVCAQQMLADPEVKAVVQGYLLTGGASFHQTLAGKLPVFGGQGQGPDLGAKNAYFLSNGPVAAPTTWGYWFKNVLHTNNVSMLYPDLPPVHRDLGVFIKLAKAQGINVKGTPYPPNGTDLTAAIAAAKPNSTGATLFVTTSASSCIAAAKGFKAAGVTKPVSALGFCTDPAVKKGLGDYPKNWTILSWYDNVNAEDSSKSVGAYLAAMSKYGKMSDVDTNMAPFGFIATVTAVKFLNQAGGPAATPETITAKADAYSGPIFMGPPVQSWQKEPVPGIGRAAGMLTSRLFTYEGNGKWADPAGGWIYADGVKPAPAAF
jgi:branched-chain amino acid transport system substrate-binding protein